METAPPVPCEVKRVPSSRGANGVERGRGSGSEAGVHGRIAVPVRGRETMQPSQIFFDTVRSTCSRFT